MGHAVARTRVPTQRLAPAGVTRALWTIVVLLSLIGVAVVMRRTFAILAPAAVPAPRGAPAVAALDAGFRRHAVLTTIHIIPGLLFILLGPLQFVRRLRNRRPRLHRWTGRVAVASGMIIGSTALVMSPQMAIGGISETFATTFFAIFFLVALVKGFLAVRRRDFASHREWMIRAYAIGLAVTTIRPIVGILFATSKLTHLTPHDFFGAAFWLGFSMHAVAAEVWINMTRPRPRTDSLNTTEPKKSRRLGVLGVKT